MFYFYIKSNLILFRTSTNFLDNRPFDFRTINFEFNFECLDISSTHPKFVESGGGFDNWKSIVLQSLCGILKKLNFHFHLTHFLFSPFFQYANHCCFFFIDFLTFKLIIWRGCSCLSITVFFTSFPITDGSIILTSMPIVFQKSIFFLTNSRQNKNQSRLSRHSIVSSSLYWIS